MHPNATITTNAETLHALAQQITDRPGSVVPFVGAGTSIPYEMPGWKGFLLYLREFAVRERSLTKKQAEGIDLLLSRGRLEEAAARLLKTLGAKFETALQSCFRIHTISTSPAMRQIIGLADGLIITTNYDRTVENAWQESFARLGVRRDVAQLLPSSPEDLRRALSGSGHAVLKLHGDVEKPETWVLTAEQYDAMYSNPAFRTFLSRFFAAHVPLFIGCSMTEERMLRAMAESDSIGYAIMAAPKLRAERRRIGDRLKRRIRVIWLEPDDVIGSGDIYELLEPVLRWLHVRRKIGAVSWDADTRPLASWANVMAGYERAGDFKGALQWICEHWKEWSSWELGVEFLRFADLAGDPSAWRVFVSEFRATLPGEATPVTEHAISYYSGRLQGQSGRWSSAFTGHAANRPYPPYADHYQVRSWFEEGQLRYRTEDFEKAASVFEELYFLLMGQRTGLRLLVDVLKFLGTMEVLDLVYDAPGSDVVWIKGNHLNPTRAVMFGKATFREATAAGYPDGCAWGVCVEAFGHEASGTAVAAEETYVRAVDLTQHSPCRASTAFHIRLYHAAFLRRQKRYDEAAETLKEASSPPLPADRAPDRLRLAEQCLLLAWARGDDSEAERQLLIIGKTHELASIDLDGSTRLERRIDRLRRDLRVTKP